jgi:hypothetical protein
LFPQDNTMSTNKTKKELIEDIEMILKSLGLLNIKMTIDSSKLQEFTNARLEQILDDNCNLFQANADEKKGSIKRVQKNQKELIILNQVIFLKDKKTSPSSKNYSVSICQHTARTTSQIYERQSCY